MGKITHYEASGKRINIKQFEHLAKNPKYIFDGRQVRFPGGTLVAYRYEHPDSEMDVVIKEGRF